MVNPSRCGSIRRLPCLRSRLHRRACAAAVVIGFLTVLAAQPTVAGVAQTSQHDYYHLQRGERTFKSVGQVDIGLGALGSALGSGTLIGDRYVLTAGHVALDAETLDFNIGGQTYAADRWTVHHRYDNSNKRLNQGWDIALIRLDRPVTNVTPATYAISGNELGKKATAVGFGAGGIGAFGETLSAGIKRAGDNLVEAYAGKKQRLLFVDFDSDGQIIQDTEKDYPLPLEMLSAHGDSGGGLFIGNTLVGVTSFLWAPQDGIFDANFGDWAGYVRVQKFARWIKQAERDLKRNRGTRIGTPGNPILSEPLSPSEIAWQQQKYPIERLLAYSTGAMSVPEPTTAALLGVGAMLLCRRSRRCSAA